MIVQNILAIIVSLIGAIYDLKSRRIPNWLTLGTFGVILLFSIFSFKIEYVVNCILGFLAGLLLLFIPYVLGGMGAGDVKLLAALGSLVGYKDVVLIFFYSAICGLFLGLIWLLLTPGHLSFLLKTGQILPVVDKKQKVPYGIAIFMGTILYIILKCNLHIF